MSIVVGIDEAGYGPLLGPLVVSAVAFERPEDGFPRLPRRGTMTRAIGSGMGILPMILHGRDARAMTTPTKAGAGVEVTVCDSKRLFSQQRGIAELEKSVLSFLELRTPGKEFGAWLDLLEELSPGHSAKLSAFPWYRDAHFALPVGASRAAVRSGAASLQTAEDGWNFLGARCEIVEVREFNEMVGAGRNKADLLFAVTGRLLKYLRQAFTGAGNRSFQANPNDVAPRFSAGPSGAEGRSFKASPKSARGSKGQARKSQQDFLAGADPVRGALTHSCLFRNAEGECLRSCAAHVACRPGVTVFAGKQGGKRFYGNELRGLFPDAEVTATRESAAESVYCVRSAGGTAGTAMTVCFLCDGEDRSYELALASLFAKYTRELHMIAFNEYWSKRLPRAGRTTGYYCDANRFLAHALPLLDKMSVPQEMLVRAR